MSGGLLVLPCLPWKSVGTMPVMSGGHLGVRRFISAFQSHVSVIPGFALHQEQAGCPEGSEYRTSGLRMAPGDVAHVPRTPSPVAKAGPVAGHFRSRARLRRLLVRLRRPTPQRSLRSLRRRGFALYVRLRHYRSSLLAAASNSLTFVRGADRACCAPRKRQRGLISLLTDQSLPVPDAARPRRGIGVRTRQRHLAAAVLTALVVRRENGDSALFVRRVR